MVYLIHFDRPYRHCRHYIGYVNGDTSQAPEQRLQQRIEAHRRGDGANLLRVVSRAGISFQVVRVWDGKDAEGKAGRELERRLKRRKKAWELCPVCRGEQKARKLEAMLPERLIGGDDDGQDSEKTKKRCATGTGS